MKFRKDKIYNRLGKFYCQWIESMPYRNWFNPLMTFYLNFRSFPLKQAIKLPVFVYGWPKFFSLFGNMECIDVCKMGMIKLNQTNSGAPSNSGFSTAINNWGKIIFHGPCLIYTANKINVLHRAVLELGANTKIMNFVNITAHNQVFIGEYTWIAHRSQIFDSNFHFIANINKRIIDRCNKPIYIGKSCWICNTSTITAGAKIPDYTIVASNSLVNKDFTDIPMDSIIGGIPAKHIASGYRRVSNTKMEIELWKYFDEHPDEKMFALAENFDRFMCE